MKGHCFLYENMCCYCNGCWMLSINEILLFSIFGYVSLSVSCVQPQQLCMVIVKNIDYSTKTKNKQRKDFRAQYHP